MVSVQLQKEDPLLQKMEIYQSEKIWLCRQHTRAPIRTGRAGLSKL